MKKNLVVLAVLGCFAGVASAATNVTLYGTVDAGYEDWHGRGATGSGAIVNATADRKLEQGGLSENNSKFGIKGQEDLGNGLTAIFTVEGEFNVDHGETNAGQLFNRETTVGLKGSFGEVKVGRAKSQMELALGGIVPGSRVADVDLYSVAATRHSNGLFYSYDNAGFSFGADVTTRGGATGNLTEGVSDNNKIGYGVRLGYAKQVDGVTMLGRVAHQNDNTERETGGLLAAVIPYANNTNSLTVGVAYAQGRGLASDLAVAKFGAKNVLAAANANGLPTLTEGQLTDAYAVKKARTLSAVIASTFGPNDSAYVKYQQRKGTAESGAVAYNGNVWAVGYAHSLSKRTSAYADVAYARIKNAAGIDGDGKATGYSIGVAHNF